MSSIPKPPEVSQSSLEKLSIRATARIGEELKTAAFVRNHLTVEVIEEFISGDLIASLNSKVLANSRTVDEVVEVYDNPIEWVKNKLRSTGIWPFSAINARPTKIPVSVREYRVCPHVNIVTDPKEHFLYLTGLKEK